MRQTREHFGKINIIENPIVITPILTLAALGDFRGVSRRSDKRAALSDNSWGKILKEGLLDVVILLSQMVPSRVLF